MLKTLYISDLDGTLLDSNACLSDYTISTLNKLIEDGIYFSYATARTIESAKKIMADVNISVPVILMNGVLIYDNLQDEYIKIEKFSEIQVNEILSVLKKLNSTGFLYKIKDSKLTTYYENLDSRAHWNFYNERVTRYNKAFEQVESFFKVDNKNIIYFTMLDKKEKLIPVYDTLQYISGIEMSLYNDVYSKDLWYLEIYSGKASKFNAVNYLRKYCNFDKIIGFGDNFNDLPLFNACDEKYAVANAIEKLRLEATKVIGSNLENGVAKWLERNYNPTI